jgi:hypothetical protein
LDITGINIGFASREDKYGTHNFIIKKREEGRDMIFEPQNICRLGLSLQALLWFRNYFFGVLIRL